MVSRPGERRTSPRLEVVDQLFGEIVAFAVRLSVRDLGPGGFSIEGPLPFPKGAKYLFRFTTAAGDEVIIDAMSTYSRSTGDTIAPSYVSGFAFLHRSAETSVKVERLLDAMLAGLEFDEHQPAADAASAAR
jgi:hypothetical protein